MILGSLVNFNYMSSGHYCVPIDKTEVIKVDKEMKKSPGSPSDMLSQDYDGVGNMEKPISITEENRPKHEDDIERQQGFTTDRKIATEKQDQDDVATQLEQKGSMNSFGTNMLLEFNVNNEIITLEKPDVDTEKYYKVRFD